MNKLDILFGGLCGFYFDDYGEIEGRRHGRLHTILVDSKKAMGCMDRHSSSLVFRVNQLDLEHSDTGFEVFMDPGGKAFGRWDLTQTIVYLHADGVELEGHWREPVLPTELFKMSEIRRDLGDVDATCVDRRDPPEHKPVNCRVELAGGPSWARLQCVSRERKLKYQNGHSSHNEPEDEFARTLAYKVQDERKFSIVLAEFRSPSKWELSFSGDAEVAITNYPVREDLHHFRAYFDLNREPIQHHHRGWPDEMIEGVRTGCIPSSFYGKR